MVLGLIKSGIFPLHKYQKILPFTFVPSKHVLLARLLFLWRKPGFFPPRFDCKTGERCRERRKSVTHKSAFLALSWLGRLHSGARTFRAATPGPLPPRHATRHRPRGCRWPLAPDQRLPALGPYPERAAHLHQLRPGCAGAKWTRRPRPLLPAASRLRTAQVAQPLGSAPGEAKATGWV